MFEPQHFTHPDREPQGQREAADPGGRGQPGQPAAALLPEGELAIAQACLYCAVAPKSNAAYAAQKAAWASAKETGSLMPPKHILNAPTRMMKDQGYGAGYAYDHDAEDGFSGQNYFPEGMKRPVWYLPPERGFERELKKRVEYFARLRAKRQEG